MRIWTLSAIAGLLVVSLLFVAGGAAYAASGEGDRNWTDEAELSYASTSGNTDDTTFYLKNVFSIDPAERLAVTWSAEATASSSDGATTAENYSTELRADYRHTPRRYEFSIAGWQKDLFSGIESRTYIGAGAGYRILTGPAHRLKGEAALKLVREAYTDDTSASFVAGRLFALYGYHFSEKNRFTQSAEWTYDFSAPSNWLFASETALVSALNDRLSVKASHTIRYDHAPVPGLRKTDTVTKASIVASF